MNHLFRSTARLRLALILAAFTLFNSGCGNREQEAFDGSSDVRLLLRLDLKRVASLIEQQPNAADDATAAAVLELRARLAVDNATIMLIQEADSDVELLVSVPDAEQSIWSEVAANKLPGLELESNDDGTLSLKLDDYLGQEEVPKSLQELSVAWHEGQIVLGAPKRLKQIESGAWDVSNAKASRLLERIDTPDNLVSIAAVVPEDLDVDLQPLQQRLRAGEAAENIPPIGRSIFSMATSWYEGLREQLETTEAFAVGVSLEEDDRRHVRFAQLFRADDSAAFVYECLTSNTDDGGVTASIAELLQEEQVDQHVRKSGRLIEIDAAWSSSADGQVAKSAMTAIQSLMASSMGSSIEPTDGSITTRYTSPPTLVKLSSKQLKSRVENCLRAQIFPAWAHNQGDDPSMQLELETLALPNSPLSAGSYKVVSVTTTKGKNALRADGGSDTDETLHLSQAGTSYLRIPLRPGTETPELKSARLQFTLDVPSQVDVVEFSARDAAGTQKRSGKARIKVKRIERDVAEVSYRATAAAQLFAFDKTGRPLASRESMRGGGSAATRFSGEIDKLWVAVPSDAEQLTINVDVDLNGGRSSQLPDKPSDRVPVRYDPIAMERYESISKQEIRNLTVELQTADGFSNREQLQIKLPRAGHHTKVDWELYWFAKDRPITVAGFAYSQDSLLSWGSQEGLGDATAVAGWVKVQIPTNFATLAFSNGQSKRWQTRRFGYRETKLRIDRNQIIYKADDLKVMAVIAFDASGRRLKTEQVSQVNGATTHRVWGQPDRVELVVSGETIEQVMPIEIVRDGTEQAAFAAFKRQIPQYHRALTALMQIQEADRQGPYGYDEIAGLHYLHNRKQQPLRLIPIELAHACPQGTERFKYQLHPYSGYTFVRMPSDQQHVSATGQVKTFRWDEGEIKLNTGGNRSIVAIPEDDSNPTFIVRWGSAYMKFLGDEDLTNVPSQPRQEGWSEISLVRFQNSVDSLASSRPGG